MTNRTTSPSAPTPKQLAYLKSLAIHTGTSFSPPRTRWEASREIERLKQLKAARGNHVEVPRETDAAEQPYATAVQPDEVSGFGSQARWRSNPPAVAAAAPRRAGVGALTELARYEIRGCERVLYGQRIDGCVRITDRAASGAGRAYLVERELERDGHAALQALVADYTEQARELDAVPMASSTLTRHLEGTDDETAD
jgi:hypothetical protein